MPDVANIHDHASSMNSTSSPAGPINVAAAAPFITQPVMPHRWTDRVGGDQIDIDDLDARHRAALRQFARDYRPGVLR